MDKTIEMAREVNLLFPGVDVVDGSIDQLKAFEALVRADERERLAKIQFESSLQAMKIEREACAKVCDEQVERSMAAIKKSKRTTDHTVYRSGAKTAAWNAAAIRARGNT